MKSEWYCLFIVLLIGLLIFYTFKAVRESNIDFQKRSSNQYVVIITEEGDIIDVNTSKVIGKRESK
jgi:hypothetical protein